MSEQDAPRAGEVGYENEPQGRRPETGAQRRTSPGAPEPGTNQAKTEPVGEGNVSPGAGSYGADRGGTGVGTNQPDRAAERGPGDLPPAVPAGGAGGSTGGGESYRQPQRYGSSPEPIATDDEAGARAAAPGGPTSRRPGPEGSGDDAGVTSYAETPMPGTSETAAVAQGVRRAVFEDGGPAGSDLPTGTAEVPIAERRTGASDAGSSAAAQGEVPQPPVEQNAAADEQPRTDERPVTGVHRPASPSGEVGSS